MNKLLLACLFSTLITFHAQAQQDYTKDVQSTDAIIKALYEVISGEGNEPRNWDRFRYLFAKDGRLIPTTKTPDSNFTYVVWTPEEYITRFSSRTAGFFEYEIGNKTESYGTIAHVFTTYATKLTKNGPVTNRGINSIQLLKDKNRYFILNIFWCAESLGFPLPPEYLQQ